MMRELHTMTQAEFDTLIAIQTDPADVTMSMDLARGMTTIETDRASKQERANAVYEAIGVRLGLQWRTIRLAREHGPLYITGEPVEERTRQGMEIASRELLTALMLDHDSLPVAFENERMGLLHSLADDVALIDMYRADDSQLLRIPFANIIHLGNGALVAGLKGVEVAPWPERRIFDTPARASMWGREDEHRDVRAAFSGAPPPDPAALPEGAKVRWTVKGATLRGTVGLTGTTCADSDYAVAVGVEVGPGTTITQQVPRSLLELDEEPHRDHPDCKCMACWRAKVDEFTESVRLVATANHVPTVQEGNS